jgi:hypothetical protein
MVGQPGLGGHNVGPLFDSAAQTYADQLIASGNTATIVPVGSVHDMAAALVSNGYIDGGVTYFGHAGVVETPQGDVSALFLGENPGPGTNLTAQNVGTLSGANLGPNASLSIRACHAGAFGRWSIAQSLANQLNRGVYASDTGMFFSNTTTAKFPTSVSSKLPVYMLPLGGVPPVAFTPR